MANSIAIRRSACLLFFTAELLQFTGVTLAQPVELPMREWNSRESKHRSTARLLAVEGEQVQLEKKTGGTVRIASKGLSDADRAYIWYHRDALSGIAASHDKGFDPRELLATFSGLDQLHYETLWVQDVPGRVSLTTLTNDGSRLIAIGDESKAAVWDVGTGKKTAELAEFFEYASCLGAVSPDGKYFAIGGSRNGAAVWETSTGKVVSRQMSAPIAIGGVSITRDGKYLMCCDVREGMGRFPLMGGDGLKWRPPDQGRNDLRLLAAGSPKGDFLARISKNHGAVSIHNFLEGVRVPDLQFDDNHRRTACSVAVNGNYVFVGFFGGFVVANALDFNAGTARTFEFRPRSMTVDLRATSNDLYVVNIDHNRGAIEFFDLRHPSVRVDCPIAAFESPQMITFSISDDLLTVAAAEVVGQRHRLRVARLKNAFDAPQWRLGKQISRMLQEGEFRKLDALAAACQNGGKRVEWGERVELIECLMNAIYNAFPQAKELKEITDAWYISDQKSQLARVLMSRQLANEGAEALRRSVDASDEQATLANSKLTSALEIVQTFFDEPRIEEIPPDAYYNLFRIALLLKWDQDRIAPYLSRLLVEHPRDVTSHYILAKSLIPQPGDEHGLCATYVAKIADKVGGGPGDEIYADLATRLLRYHDRHEFFSDAGFDYQRCLRGCVAWQASFPPDSTPAQALLKFSHIEIDKETGRKAVELMKQGVKWSPGVWRNSEELFNAQVWAREPDEP